MTRTRSTLTRIASRLRRYAGRPAAAQPKPASLRHPALVARLAAIPYWEDKIAFAKAYAYAPAEDIWRLASAPAGASTQPEILRPEKVNYGCGTTLRDGWLNCDIFDLRDPRYRQVDLLARHPFPDASVRFGFCEDVLEHFTQAQSLLFLSEIARTFAPGGVFRLSFPGLEGVLTRHYTPAGPTRLREGELEAYAYWDHIHFYARAELDLVARHLGFRDVRFVEYGKSDHPELVGLDTREHQIGLNTYAELTR